MMYCLKSGEGSSTQLYSTECTHHTQRPHEDFLLPPYFDDIKMIQRLSIIVVVYFLLLYDLDIGCL